MTIRRYGPGKFHTKLDATIYGFALATGADSLGDVERGWAYTLLPGAWSAEEIRDLEKYEPEYAPLTEEERELILGTMGIIAAENDQGFVYVEYYPTVKEYESVVEKIEADESDDAEAEILADHEAGEHEETAFGDCPACAEITEEGQKE